MIPIVLVGAGGHCRSCIDVIEMTNKFEIAALVGRPEEVGTIVLGYPIKDADEQLPALVEKYQNFLITIGQIKSNAPRVRLYEKIRSLGGQFPTVVSPLAFVSKHAKVADGTIVMHHAMVNASASIGENCIVNSKALIEHDTVVGDHCHISTGAILNGHSRIDANCFVGSGAIVHQEITIGSGNIVPSAARVFKDLSPRQ